MCTSTHEPMHVEAKGKCQVFCSIMVCLIPLRKGLPLNIELHCQPASHTSPHIFNARALGYIVGFRLLQGIFNSGPQASKASVLNHHVSYSTVAEIKHHDKDNFWNEEFIWNEKLWFQRARVHNQACMENGAGFQVFTSQTASTKQRERAGG